MISPGHPAYAMPGSIDDQVRRQKDNDRNLREQAAARTLESSQISAGGLIFSGGGSITIQDGASLTVDGGTIDLTSGDLNVSGDITAGETIVATGSITGSEFITTGDVTATGTLTSLDIDTGNVSAIDLDLTGDLRAQSVYDTVLTTDYRAVYVTGVDGQLGHVPSSIKYKTNVKPSTIDLDALDQAEVVFFQYKSAVEELGGENRRIPYWWCC